MLKQILGTLTCDNIAWLSMSISVSKNIGLCTKGRLIFPTEISTITLVV